MKGRSRAKDGKFYIMQPEFKVIYENIYFFQTNIQ